MRKEKVVTIPMSLKESHLRENYSSSELKLLDEDIAVLDRLPI